MDTTFITGTLTSIDTTFINPYSGESLRVFGDYYINDTFLFGGVGAFDILQADSEDQLFTIEDSSGVLLFDGFEILNMSNGDDILLLASATNVVGDVFVNMGNGNDFFWGNAGNDHIDGSNGDDVLHGGPGQDSINGSANNDTITGGSGDDMIDGGLDLDIAVYHGDFASYTIVDNAGVLTIADNVGSEGTDTVSNVEVVQFDNGTYSMGVFTPSVAAVPAMDVLGLFAFTVLLAACGVHALRRRLA